VSRVADGSMAMGEQMPKGAIRGRTVIITGANSGIGKAAAVRFAAGGDRVVMACRDLERSERARKEVMAASGSDRVELMRLDVSSFASVREFCAAFRERHPVLDVLVHNAGYFNHGIRTYQFSPDGVELTFATNVFGPQLMTELLVEPLSRSADARVLFASSTNLKNFFDPKRAIEFDNLRGEHSDSRRYSVYRMYGDSKMGLLLLTYRMAEEYAELGIKVNAIMIPATRVEKATLRKLRSYFRVIGPIVQNLNPWALEPEDIAASYHHICTSAEFQEISGTLIDHRNRVIEPAESDRPLGPLAIMKELRHTRHTPAYANAPENIERMWKLGREVIGSEMEPQPRLHRIRTR
jgi:NAD(P)-dependent dehydrogenase (short-subunit alcohol dehydrogenase family)